MYNARRDLFYVGRELMTIRRTSGLLALLLIFTGLTACASGPTGITQAVTAREVKPETFDPIDITSTFPGNQAKYHAVISISNLPKDSVIKAVWTAIDVGTAASPNTEITS